MFRNVLLASVLCAGACTSPLPLPEVPLPEASLSGSGATETAYAVSDKMQEARGFLFSHAEHFLADPTAPSFAGGYAQAVTMMGREDLMALVPPEDIFHRKQECSENLQPALPYIRAMAESHTLVILNESHSRPQHRAFIGEVVDMLQAEGFTHYAAETLRIEGAQHLEGPAKVGQGWYIHDPIFARLLERIRALGMVLVAYEETEEQRLKEEGATIEEIVAVREEAQAQNLVDAVLGKAPDTRMIIHVGYGHIEEFTTGDIPMMVARLKSKTGIDPFTIDLVYCGSVSGEPLITPLINGRPAREWGGTDVAVRPTEPTFVANRPDYRRSADTRDIPVPAELRPAEGLAIIEARLMGQDDEVIPVDRLLLRPGEEIPLILPPGDYFIAAFNGEGLSAGPVSLSVPP